MSTYDYYPAVLYALDLISQGRTITDACDQANITPVTLDKYVERDPQLQELRADAERRGYDAMADALINIDNHKVHGQSDPKMAKVISDNIKWLLSKRRFKDYGDKVEVRHEVTMDKAIVSALEHARNRTLFLPPHTIDAVAVELSDDDLIMSDLLS